MGASSHPLPLPPQRLIEKEPLDQLETAVREQAMLVVAALR